MNYQIQTAIESDLPKVLALQKLAFKQVAAAMNNPDILPLQQTLDELQYEFAQGTILICVHDNEIIGSVRAKLNNDNSCYIGKLIVHPDYQNQGIGKVLIGEIEKYYSTCSNYTLFTGIDTPNTLHLYVKLGYQETKREYFDHVWMVFLEKMTK